MPHGMSSRLVPWARSPRSVELGLPLVREGGFVLAWKREEERAGLAAELRDAGSIIRACGGGTP